jgi:hypothetical protein
VVNAVVEGKTNSMAGGIFQRQGESRIVASHSACVQTKGVEYCPGGSSSVGGRERGQR